MVGSAWQRSNSSFVSSLWLMGLRPTRPRPMSPSAMDSISISLRPVNVAICLKVKMVLSVSHTAVAIGMSRVGAWVFDAFAIVFLQICSLF